ncbi:helix-turn-helix transcriptional regulator [Myxococcota bacterium]|nr:helix-turn-helix transcriptional regulator [Myxococcota bacterium]
MLDRSHVLCEQMVATLLESVAAPAFILRAPDPDVTSQGLGGGHASAHVQGTSGANGHGANGHGANGHGANGHGANGHGANGHGNGHARAKVSGREASPIVRANSAGRLRLEISPELESSFRDLVRGREIDNVDVTALVAPGVPDHFFVVIRQAPASVTERLAFATAAWKLTPRQRQVLDLIVRGEPTKVIAAELGCSTRAVELHITALLDRAGVDSRSALVTTFWTLS